MKIKNVIIAILLLISIVLSISACSLVNKDIHDSNDDAAIDKENNNDDNVDIEIDLGADTDKNQPGADNEDEKDDQTDKTPSEDVVNTDVTYEQYLAMSAEEREAHYNSFAEPAEFFDWFNAALAKYEEENKKPVLGEDGSVDIEDILGGQ